MATPDHGATLADYTSPPLIIPRLAAENPADALRELSLVLHADGRVADPARFCQAVLDRESKCSTALDGGIAVPHARTTLARDLCFALGRCPRPLAWGAGGTGRVQLVFLIAAPAAEPVAYLRLVAALARWCADPVAVTRLKTVTDAGEMFALLARGQARSSSTADP